jgi:hypothetical protein
MPVKSQTATYVRVLPGFYIVINSWNYYYNCEPQRVLGTAMQLFAVNLYPL